MDKFAGLIIAAIATEGVITYLKTFIVDKKFQWQMLLGLLIGALIAFSYQLDLLMSLMGLESVVPYVGVVITGTALSRGSNYVFDFINRITNWKGGGGSNAKADTTDK